MKNALLGSSLSTVSKGRVYTCFFTRRMLMLFSGFCVLCLPSGLGAREKFNTAFKVSLSGAFTSRLSWLAEEDFRPSGDFGQGEWSLSTAELNYRLFAWLRTGAGYMLMARLHRSDGLRNRYYFYATASYRKGAFAVSLRERFQSTYRAGGAHPANYLRSMLTVSYVLGGSGAAPFVYAEPFNNTGYKGGMKADKIRFSAGCDYRIDGHNSLQLYYRYHLFNVYDPLNYRHALGVTYSHRF